LDKKSLVFVVAMNLSYSTANNFYRRTHVITCALTPAKVREFQHMKVVTPDWLVESAKAGVLLPWQDFLFRPSDRPEIPQGAQTQKLFPRVSGSQASLCSLSAVLFSGSTNTTTRQAFQEPGLQQSTLPFAPGPPSKILDPLYTTDPVTAEQAARVPDYAAHASNPNAERVMADPQWRAAHTSVAPDFIEGYYKNSRLHHLSAWKTELKDLVAEAQERAESFLSTTHTGDRPGIAGTSSENPGRQGTSASVSMRGAELIMRSPNKGKGKAEADNDGRVIMHCDFDCFFVSAGLVSRPHLRGKPVVVCHSQGGQGGQSSTSEIASSSYEARKFGIRNGMRYEVVLFRSEYSLNFPSACSKLVSSAPQ
jgi:DNA repair protein REV1